MVARSPQGARCQVPQSTPAARTSSPLNGATETWPDASGSRPRARRTISGADTKVLLLPAGRYAKAAVNRSWNAPNDAVVEGCDVRAVSVCGPTTADDVEAFPVQSRGQQSGGRSPRRWAAARCETVAAWQARFWHERATGRPATFLPPPRGPLYAGTRDGGYDGSSAEGRSFLAPYPLARLIGSVLRRLLPRLTR